MANGRYCPKCKRITDRLYASARSQGKTQWLSDQLADPKSSRTLIRSYNAKFPEDGKGDMKTGKFIAQYHEEIEAESAILCEADGIMCDEDVFVSGGSGLRCDLGGLVLLGIVVRVWFMELLPQ